MLGLVAVRKYHVVWKQAFLEVGHRADASSLALGSRTRAQAFSVMIGHSNSPSPALLSWILAQCGCLTCVPHDADLYGRAQIATFEINPHTAIAIDTGHGRDIPGLSVSEFGRLDLGAGPGIARGANTNPLVFDLMKSAAEKDSIPFQTTAAAGTTPTDANALQVSGRGSATGLLEVPLRYMHTPSEVLHLTDVENCARLLAAYCRAVTPDTQFSPGLRISQDDKRR
jgi:hypothetical protein